MQLDLLGAVGEAEGTAGAEVLLERVRTLRRMYLAGRLGGEVMPEDAAPRLPSDSIELYHYFTLGMALNYQRNSYSLWAAATATYNDSATRWVFRPQAVADATEEDLRGALLRYRLALQPVKHIGTWRAIAQTLAVHFRGDVRVVLETAENDVIQIADLVQVQFKDGFPYLKGQKIFHYWLHVLEQYTATALKNRAAISVAPDTHVVQSSLRLGLVPPTNRGDSTIQKRVAEEWQRLLNGTELVPIDVHTPLWLWSRAGFPPLEA
jgi:hypothetical protein